MTSIGASATVLVIDRDPLTLDLARRAIADHYRIIVAENGTDALAMIDEHHPDIVMIDMTFANAEIAMVTVALAACDELDSTPVIMVDPEQPTNAMSLRRRIDEAIRVTRRIYMGGGLLHRVAA